MKPLRLIITVVCFIASSIAHAGEQRTAKTQGVVHQPTNAELQLLQGTWEGFEVGGGAAQKVTITITNSSLHFHRDTNFWFETTMTLPAGKDPRQLHATIKRCPPSQAGSEGQVVKAFFKIEHGTLTVAPMNDETEETLKGFAALENRYELRKVQPKNAQPPKTK